MRGLPIAVLLVLPGCLQGLEDEAVTPAVADPALLQDRWSGSGLAGRANPQGFVADYGCWAGLPCEGTDTPCEQANCERRAFDVPEGAGAITVSLRWLSVPGSRFGLWIEDADGNVVSRADHRYPATTGLLARAENPPAGTYHAVVAARVGTVDYEAAIRVEPPVAATGNAPRPLLPNLVTLPPTDLILETPSYTGASYFAFPVPMLREAGETAGIRGCRIDETAERRHVRCLRFSNAVGNTGEGPLDVVLRPGSTSFLQRIHHSDGSIEEHPGGPAEWHATHAHWHNAATNQFALHTYDATNRVVGDALDATGTKGGICFADTGILDVGLPYAQPARFTAWSCLSPDPAAGWAMGITPGWYDLYAYILSDQYLELGDVEDGDYALCSVTNAEGTLAETDLSDNAACTPFRLAGDTLQLLDPAPYHTIPESSRI